MTPLCNRPGETQPGGLFSQPGGADFGQPWPESILEKQPGLF